MLHVSQNSVRYPSIVLKFKFYMPHVKKSTKIWYWGHFVQHADKDSSIRFRISLTMSMRIAICPRTSYIVFVYSKKPTGKEYSERNETLIL